ncbi:MAG: hypothetical protein DMF68_01565 [Acidobacteria bacterium]|nr:MAG: hypothetical protein DMF68_01565 [Acidobacteriota bacterium]
MSDLESEVERLRAAIRRHRDSRADDRCWMDDEELYAALGDAVPCDRRVGDKLAMLQNCARFIERRCEGGYWPSYVELEAEIKRLEETAEKYYQAMQHLRAQKLPHGRCEPREARACTRCNAADDLEALVNAYKGRPIVPA